jgi:hypothetical protein
LIELLESSQPGRQGSWTSLADSPSWNPSTLWSPSTGCLPCHPLKDSKDDREVERGFLWAGRAAANGGRHHVNWRRGARPIAHGSLGVYDMERTGLALRLCSLWLSRTDDRRALQGLDLQFSTEEHTFFFAFTAMHVGNGLMPSSGWIAGWMGIQSARLRRCYTRASPSDAGNRRP